MGAIDPTQAYVVVTFGCNDDGQLGRETDASECDPALVPTANSPPKKQRKMPADSVLLPLPILTFSSSARHQKITITAISCGSRHTLALDENNGIVYSWGWGAMGQLGHGQSLSITCPTIITALENKNMSYISAGGCHSGAVTTEGHVYVWGEAHWGQLGLACTTPHQLSPVQLPPIAFHDHSDRVLKMSCGGAHTGILTTQGRVYTWGRGDNGQLGIGQSINEKITSSLGVFEPRLVEALVDQKVIHLACGAFHSAAVTDDGYVYTWGKEDYGMLGVGKTVDLLLPRRLEEFGPANKAKRVSCGGWHTIVVTVAGKCFSFGRGEYGRLGLNDTKSRLRPHEIGMTLKQEVIHQSACGGTHSLFLTSTGKAFSTGRREHGRLGYVSPSPTIHPEDIEALNAKALSHMSLVQLSAGGAHSAALFHTHASSSSS